MVMDLSHLPQTIASLAFFGLMVVFPITYLLLKHQRAMAELINGRASNETLVRLENLERDLRELKAASHEQAIAGDQQRDLTQRIT